MTTLSLAPALLRSQRLLWWRALPALLIGLLAWGLLFHAELAAAVAVWIDSTAYNHGFFVLPLAAWLAWDRRAAAAGLAPAATAWPVLAALPLALAWFAADRLGIMEARQLAALGVAEALLVGWLGWKLARVFAAPLAYLVFLVPFGAFLTGPLQVFTARFVDAGLELLAIPHVVTAFIIEIPEGTFFVAEACAGLRFLIAAIAFGALYALLIYRSPWRRLAFLAAACVVPVIANGLRALGIVVLGHILGSAEAAAADHIIYGWGFFSVVILLLTAAGLPFRQDTTARPAAVALTPPAPGSAAAWLALAGVLVLAAAGPAAAAWLDRRVRTAATPALPGFAAAGGCRATGATAAGQAFDCDGVTLTARVRVLPAGAGPAALTVALQDATAERGVEDVMHDTLPVAGVVPRRWRLTTLSAPPRMTASAVFVDGRPAPAGLALRWRLAADGIGGGGTPVLVTAMLATSALAAPPVQAAAREQLAAFLSGQGNMLAAAAAASAAPAQQAPAQ